MVDFFQIERKKNEKNSGDILKLSKINVCWLLVFYDMCMYVFVDFLLLLLGPGWGRDISTKGALIQMLLGGVCILFFRFAMDVYRQVWRYGGIQAYMRLLSADVMGGALYCILNIILPIERISLINIVVIICMNLLGAMGMRMVYHYLCPLAAHSTRTGRFVRFLILFLSGVSIKPDEQGKESSKKQRIKIAIVGAGRVGVGLAEELLSNPTASYLPSCFIDISKDKIGRHIYGIPVLPEPMATHDKLEQFGIREIVFALPQISMEERKALYEYYKKNRL